MERRPSFTTEELTPIVLSQLQTTTKKKEESRRQRRENARDPIQKKHFRLEF